MQRQNARRGFTLIELLVVILIVGILIAIAVPQYQKAAEKGRSVEVITLLRSLGQMQEMFFLREGQYATSFGQLEVSLTNQWQPSTQCYRQVWMTDCIENEYWNIGWTGKNGYNWRMFLASRTSGPYKDELHFAYVFTDDGGNHLPKGRVLCISRKNGVCPQLFHGTYEGNWGSGTGEGNAYSLE